jgi:predicted Zn-dependent peptidase
VTRARARFKRTVFANGLILVSERQPGFKSLAIGVWVKVGTRNERPREAGMSHFLEHMLFKGTDTRTALDIALQVDQVGGDFNAFTGREFTCFHVLLLARDAGLAFDILGDVVLNSTFDAEELERERKVILQEITMAEESPEEIAYDIYFELIYGRHGLGTPILGSENSVRKLKRADVLRYFKRYYRPDQLVISVAGDVSHEQVKKMLRPLIRRNWPGRPEGREARAIRRERPPAAEPAPKVRDGRWWIKRDTEQVHLIWGVESPSYSSRDRYAASLLNVHLGGGMSSTLFQEIREKHGLAYTVYSSLSPYRDSGVFSIYAATNMSQVPLCLKLIEECVQQLRGELLTHEQLQVAKENLKGTILLSADSVESRMMSIANNEMFLKEYMSAEEVCRGIDAVTPADIRRLARKLFKPGRASVLALGPKPSKQVMAKFKPILPKRYNR